ncbi:cupin domain-containing protein [bacterium]|nr:cupin domain-containing protein [bacterium]
MTRYRKSTLALALSLLLAAGLFAQEGREDETSLSPEDMELFDLEALDQEPATRDSLRRARQQGYGWLDSLYGDGPDSLQIQGGGFWSDSLLQAAPDSMGEAWPISPPRDLPFMNMGLQDLLRSSPLAENEDESWTDIFSVDSLLSLSLLQVREEAWPCYYPYSDLWIYIWRGWGQLIHDGLEEEYSPGRMFQVPAGSIHSLRNISGAPTVALVWSSPPADSVRVRIVPDEILEQMQADSLRVIDLEERIIYRSGKR